MKATEEFYRNYIDCLNKGDLAQLADFIQDKLTYNGEEMTLEDFEENRLNERRAIPDLYYDIHLLVTDEDTIASRLNFDCTPTGQFIGIIPNGNRVVFSENVFYKLKEGKISSILSLIDRDAIRKQLC